MKAIRNRSYCKKHLRSLAAAVMLLAPLPCHAHYLWLEHQCGPEADRSPALLFFGEYQQDVRETKETRLTERAGAALQLIDSSGAPTALASRIEQTAITSDEVSCNDTAVVAADERTPVADLRKYRIGVVRPMYYARAMLGTAPQTPKPVTALDILPVDPAPNGKIKVGKKAPLKIYFKGKPVSQRLELTVYAPNGWAWEGDVQPDGTVSFTPLWPGRYVVEGILLEESEGTYEGKQYEAVRYRSTLTLQASE